VYSILCRLKHIESTISIKKETNRSQSNYSIAEKGKAELINMIEC